MSLSSFIHYFETLSPESLSAIHEIYSADVYFKDPFNEVRGIGAVTHIFRHMYTQVHQPRFEVSESFDNEQGAMIVWRMFFSHPAIQHGAEQTINGCSLLRFNDDGKVGYHRDYWDTSEELFQKMPFLAILVRALRRKLSAQ